MRKYLLPQDGTFYKANLHCHTTMSDGRLTPQQVKEAYQERGYSVVAYTDHEIFLPHYELTDENFVALHGFELGINEETVESRAKKRIVHLCLIALSPDNLLHPFWHRTKYISGNALTYRNQVQFDESKPDFEKIYTPECINRVISEGKENGFFVTYNHPTWSLEGYDTYRNYRGMHALEIYNYDCILQGYDACVPHIYDDLLRGGERLFCIGADDNHNIFPFDSRYSDSFGAFTMIKAEKLSYTDITNALVKGNFYASQGPEIYELYYENQHIHITCSKVDCIRMNTGVRYVVPVYDESGDGLTKAVFRVDDPALNYVRFTITDKYGKHAHTNAYFCKDFADET